MCILCSTAPGILYQVLVMTENEIGSGPAVIQEFFTKQLSKQSITMSVRSCCMLYL